MRRRVHPSRAARNRDRRARKTRAVLRRAFMRQIDAFMREHKVKVDSGHLERESAA